MKHFTIGEQVFNLHHKSCNYDLLIYTRWGRGGWSIGQPLLHTYTVTIDVNWVKLEDYINRNYFYLNNTWALSPVLKHSEDILMMEAVCLMEPQWTMAWYLGEMVVG